MVLQIQILNNLPENEYSVIVVGGLDGGEVSTVEVFDEDSIVWRRGPDLPFGICCGELVEDSAGGVVLVGGQSRNDVYLSSLFRLPHLGNNGHPVR